MWRGGAIRSRFAEDLRRGCLSRLAIERINGVLATQGFNEEACRARMCNHSQLTSRFQGLSSMTTTFDFLRREPEIRAYKRGQTIFKQGDPGSDCMFAVVEGAINIELEGVTVERGRSNRQPPGGNR
jgi:hypothetical protein